MIIKVDIRGTGEDAIFSLLNQCNASDYTIEKANLDVGDYHILRHDGTLAVVVERKSHNDLAGSLTTNNHIKEQVHRLKAIKAQKPRVVVFLLYEGILDSKWVSGKSGSLPNANACMFLTTATTREGLCVHYTVSREHTAKWLYAMAKKEEKGQLRAPIVVEGSASPTAPHHDDYLQTLALTKQGNRKFENQWVRLLMSIDSVSLDRARAIAEEYPNCAKLVERVLEDGAEDVIANIQVKKRKLGPALAKSIVAIFKK